MELDNVDREILELLQIDCRLSAEHIGNQVGLSPSSTHRRIQRMRESRVILSEIAIVDPKTVGRPLVMIVQLAIQRESTGQLDAMRTWIANEPNVQQGWYVTGESDYVLIVTVRDVEDYQEFMQRLLTENPNVRTFETSVTLSTLKRGLGLSTKAATSEE